MSIKKYVSIPVFLVSFAIGVFVAYILDTERKKVYVYPTPQNQNIVQYKDSAGQCFQVDMVETECPLNPLSVKHVPMQQ